MEFAVNRRLCAADNSYREVFLRVECRERPKPPEGTLGAFLSIVDSALPRTTRRERFRCRRCRFARPIGGTSCIVFSLSKDGWLSSSHWCLEEPGHHHSPSTSTTYPPRRFGFCSIISPGSGPRCSPIRGAEHSTRCQAEQRSLGVTDELDAHPGCHRRHGCKAIVGLRSSQRRRSSRRGTYPG